MPFIRALTLLCFGFGLFVQVAAHAAAVPQHEAVEGADCAEMAQAMPEHNMRGQEEPSDSQGPCRDMTLECLVALNCLPPLALTDTGVAPAAPLPVVLSYRPASTVRLQGEPMRPESPPPQDNLTV